MKIVNCYKDPVREKLGEETYDALKIRRAEFRFAKESRPFKLSITLFGLMQCFLAILTSSFSSQRAVMLHLEDL